MADVFYARHYVFNLIFSWHEYHQFSLQNFKAKFVFVDYFWDVIIEPGVQLSG